MEGPVQARLELVVDARDLVPRFLELQAAAEDLEAEVLGQGRAEVEGPAIFELPGATLVVPPGWSAQAGGDAVVMERA